MKRRLNMLLKNHLIAAIVSIGLICLTITYVADTALLCTAIIKGGSDFIMQNNAKVKA